MLLHQGKNIEENISVMQNLFKLFANLYSVIIFYANLR